MSNREYSAIVYPVPEEDGTGFVAVVPDLPGCMSYGETQESAIADLRSAIEEWIDEAKRLGRKVPKPGDLVNRVKKEQERINDLVQAQDKFIREQDKRLKDARSGLEKAKKNLSDLLKAKEDHLTVKEGRHHYMVWSATAVSVPRAPCRT